MKIDPSNLPGGYRHLDFTPRHPWGDEVFIQWGKLGRDRGFFVEVFPEGTYLRGEGPTLAEAEGRAWKQHQREIACPAHRWSPMQPGMGERFDGYGVCLDCQRHQADVLPVRTVCAKCGETVKLYTAKLCEPCYGACDDAELERFDGRNSLEMRIRARELAHYRATTSPEQQAEDIAVGLAAIFDSFADKENP